MGDDLSWRVRREPRWHNETLSPKCPESFPCRTRVDRVPLRCGRRSAARRKSCLGRNSEMISLSWRLQHSVLSRAWKPNSLVRPGFYRLRSAHLAGAVAGLNGLIAGAEGLQVRRRDSLGRSAIRSVKWLAMDRGNIRDCVLRRFGRSLFRRVFGAANKAARDQQGGEGEFSQCLHSLAFFS